MLTLFYSDIFFLEYEEIVTLHFFYTRIPKINNLLIVTWFEFHKGDCDITFFAIGARFTDCYIFFETFLALRHSIFTFLKVIRETDCNF